MRPPDGGFLVIEKPWPGMLRGIWGDDQRFVEQYWSRYQEQGWYLAGDSARKDDDGYFWVIGRIDDVIKVAGYRLGTAEIESALVAHEAVAEAVSEGWIWKPLPVGFSPEEYTSRPWPVDRYVNDGMQIDLGPGLSAEGLEVIDQTTATIATLTVDAGAADTLEPFAKGLWRNEVRDFASAGDRFGWRRETIFGDLFQKVVATRER